MTFAWRIIHRGGNPQAIPLDSEDLALTVPAFIHGLDSLLGRLSVSSCRLFVYKLSLIDGNGSMRVTHHGIHLFLK